MNTPSPPIPLATLEAVLERVTYANEETGYTVARVTTRGSKDLLTGRRERGGATRPWRNACGVASAQAWGCRFRRW